MFQVSLKQKSFAMSSLPNEVLEHVLHPLDRWTLDAAQFTNRRFLQLIMKRMSDLYLRKIEFANFTVTNASSVGVAEYAVRIDGRPVRRDSAAYYIADLFSEFLHLLRGSSVAYLYLWGKLFHAFCCSCCQPTCSGMPHEMVYS